MRDALELTDLAIKAVAMIDVNQCTPTELADACITVQQHIDRLKAQHTRFVHAGDRSRIWAGGATGARSMADWLAQRTNTSYGEASRRVKLGEAFEKAPELADAVASGEMSAATAEALAETVNELPAGDDLDSLVDSCKGAGPRDAKAAANTLSDIRRQETPEEAEERRYRKRSVISRSIGDGMTTTTITLPDLSSRQITDAFASAAGKPYDGDTRTTEQRLADGATLLADAYIKGQVQGGREKPTLLITIDVESFNGHADNDGVSDRGDRIPAHVVRRLAENATIQRVLTIGSRILDLGMDVRYATEQQYRALVVRDGGCRWPGCHIPARWCEADHLMPWENGGPTDLDNLALWCTHHHHEKHRPGVTVHGDANNLRLRFANGETLHCPPQHRPATPRHRPATAAA